MALLKDTLIQQGLIRPDSTRAEATEAAHALAREVVEICEAIGVNPRERKTLISVVKRLKRERDEVVCFYKVLSRAYDLAHVALVDSAKDGSRKAKEVLKFLEDIQKGETS